METKQNAFVVKSEGPGRDENGILSAPEKKIMCMIAEEQPMLPYSIITIDSECVYELPEDEDKRLKILKQCSLFQGNFDSKKKLFDLHSNTFFRNTESGIIRYNNRNLVVTPKYLEYGGMEVDMVKSEDLNSDSMVYSTRKQK